jgi:hypothetical protein
MVRGVAARVESQGDSMAFLISGDGTVTSRDSRIQTAGSGIAVNWGN